LLSLLICAAVIAAWVHGCCSSTPLRWHTDTDGGGPYRDVTAGDDLAITWLSRNPDPRSGEPSDRFARDMHLEWWGFSYRCEPVYGYDTLDSTCLVNDHRLTLSYWFCAAIASVWPGIWVWRELRRRNRAAFDDGYCTCGYNLRASTDRCPECGTPISSRSHAETQT
jgi:hypothetical protein